MISFYERQAKRGGTVTFYDTIGHVTQRAIDTLPRSLKRLSESVNTPPLRQTVNAGALAIFEGLAGADADIDAVRDAGSIEPVLIVIQVFEIENEYESALDTDGTANDSSRGQRRPSGGSNRREHLSKIIPRARLSSSVHHPPEFQSTSPLAQVFNPILDANTRLEPGISFGPATRRRVTSMPPSQLQTPERQHQLQTFPSSRERESPSPNHDDENESLSKGTIIKAGDELGNGLDFSIIQRLDAMEQRHQRIEELLLQLSQSVSGIKTSHS